MSDFNVRRLANHRALVSGHDEVGTAHQTVLDTTQWDELNDRSGFSAAIAEYDQAIAEFFKPLTEAADRVQDTLKVRMDPAFYVVEQEAEPSREGKQEMLTSLDHDSVVIRLIEQGREDRLVWVGDTIEVLALPEDPAPVQVSVTTDDGDGLRF